MEKYNAHSPFYRQHSMLDLISLKGRTIVITGGARGLALSWARGCAELGGNLAVIDRLDAPDPEFALLETECGVKARFYKGDVTDSTSLDAIFQQINTDFGSIDHLVTAAGIGGGAPLHEQPLEQINQIIAVNLLGSIYACRLAIPYLLASSAKSKNQSTSLPSTLPAPSIVTVSSIGGHASIPGQTNAVYCASKGGILSFTKALAVELAPQGIRVNSISPGYFITDMSPGYKEKNWERLEGFAKVVPLGERMADRGEGKAVVPFLLCGGAGYVTGADLVVDGGVLAA